LPYTLIVWIVIGVGWIGGIWWFRRGVNWISAVVLTLCFALCTTLGYLLYDPQLEISGMFMALFANGIVISGMAADYASMRL
jgi:hypothetical protein